MTLLQVTTHHAIANVSDNVNERCLGLFLAQKRRKSTKTAEQYERVVRDFLVWIGDTPLDMVTIDILSVYVDSLYRKPYKKEIAAGIDPNARLPLAPATHARITTTLRSFFAYLDVLGILRVNPAAAVAVPAVANAQDSAVERVLTEDEARRFLDVLRPVGLYEVDAKRLPFAKLRNYVTFAVLLTTGVRIAEGCGASWRDLYEDNAGNIGLRIKGKGNRIRDVKIRPDVWKLLRELRKCSGLATVLDPTDTAPLFPNEEGEACSDRYFRKVATQTAQAARIAKNVSPHWFRHTSATFALEGGADVEQVRRQLGHSTLQHTTRYLHNTRGLRDTAADHIAVEF